MIEEARKVLGKEYEGLTDKQIDGDLAVAKLLSELIISILNQRDLKEI